MNWEAIEAITAIIGTLAVIASLLYLSRQILDSNRQAELEGLRHTLDGFNDWTDLIIGSKETAELLIKGRANPESLDETENLQFECLHLRLLNTMEAWCRSVEETARSEAYRQTQIENLEEVVGFWFDNPGARRVWSNYKAAFPLLVDTFDSSLVKATSRRSESAADSIPRPPDT
jgi:hypothetical protein